MAHFTSTEANACTVNANTRREFKDGVFQYWVMAVNDAEGNYYDWKDESTAEGADNATVKTAIHDYLVANCEKKGSKPVITRDTPNGLIDFPVG